jgi:DNA-directed RNA polymerase specialized sigma24 family protein
MASGWKGQPDFVVINALQAGDEKALGEIYDRYGLMVYRLALKILGNSNDAEDLTQEVFVTFWQGVRTQTGNTLDFSVGSDSITGLK